MQEHLVIVGGGQAAVQAVATLRQTGFGGRISIIGDESHAPYQRPPLSKKYLAGEMPRDRLALRPASFYQKHAVDLDIGTRAIELDASARSLRLDDGRVIGYDKLLIATGSRVRRTGLPGERLRGVHYLRTIDDVDAIVTDFAPGARLVLVGAGYIGLEVAAVAARRGLDVTVLEVGQRVMGRVVCPDVSAFYDRLHARAGVKLRYDTAVTAFVGDERVQAVETAGGATYSCDCAIVGVGVEPNTDLGRTAGLECENGIVVDGSARTADPCIAAAGDCTYHPHPLAERPVRLESVQNAVEQAKTAASNLAGVPREYTEVPWFWSDQYDVKLQIAGLAHGSEEITIRGDPADGRFAVYHFRDRVLIAVEAIDSPRDFMFGKRLIAAKWRGSSNVLADPNVDLAKLADAVA